MSGIVVLASGAGSNLQALLDAGLPVSAVVSDRADAGALDRAMTAGVSCTTVRPMPGESRAEYDARLAEVVGELDPQLVVLAGWMRLLSMAFLMHFPMRVVNLHPALPGELPGMHAIERALAAGLSRTGVMVHLVPDEGVDDGPVLGTVEVPIEPGDTVESLSARIHLAEHDLLVSVVDRLLDGTLAAPVTTPVTTTP
jgi:phosphoribosylglycinamide formyltransferase 1